MPANIRVEVAYALPEKQYLQRVTLDEGATVEQAIVASGLLALRDDIDWRNKVVFTVVRLSCTTKSMTATGWKSSSAYCRPKELRRQRAEKSAAK